MKRISFLTITFLFTLSLYGQGNRNAFVIGGGIANPFSSYVEEKPGPAFLIGYERIVTQTWTGFETLVGINYQYHNFTNTRTRGTFSSSIGPIRGTDHSSHEATLSVLALKLGVRKRIRNFSASAFVEGTYLLGARYRGFSGEIINDAPQVTYDEFTVSLSEGDENTFSRYRVRPDAHRFYANVGADMSYRLAPRWEVGLRYMTTLGYQEVGLESAPLCFQQSDCGEFRQRIANIGGNDHGTVLLVSKFSF